MPTWSNSERRPEVGGSISGEHGIGIEKQNFYGTARDLVIDLRVIGPDGAVLRSGGKVVAFQMAAGLRGTRVPMRGLHVVELLDQTSAAAERGSA